MSVSESDFVFRKPVVITNTGTNGGRKGSVLVVSGTRHSLFPRVTKAERTAGVTRYRKEFLANENADDETAYDALIYLELPSTSGDRFYLRSGTQRDIQSSLETYDPLRIGTGAVNSAVTAGDTSVAILMESNDYVFPNGDYLHIADKVMTGQTIASSVSVGDSVEYNDTSAQWEKITYTDDIAYPNGLCVGADLVMSTDDDTNEEWLQIKTNLTEDESIGTGDGASLTVTLSTLANATNGICRKKGVDTNETGHPVVVTAPPTGGGSDMVAKFDPDGTLDTANSDATAGELDMTDGTWTTDITWDTAPAAGSDNITITYAENAFSYAGNVCTVQLETGVQFANSYNADSSAYAGSCLSMDEIIPEYDGWTETCAGDGTYDESSYPPVLFNDGTEEDDWTITFTGATSFTCSGAYFGSLGTGSTLSDFSPTNPDTDQPYFTIDKDGWAGTWASGDTVEFSTSPSALPLWLEQLVPAATSADPNNLVALGWYCE
jgi:hypothetical protein